MSNWLGLSRYSSLKKTSQGSVEYEAEDSVDSYNNLQGGESKSIPEEIQFLVREYFSLLKSEDSQVASIMYNKIQQRASALGVSDFIDEYISEEWLKSSVEGFSTVDTEDVESGAYPDGDWTGSTSQSVVSFIETLSKLNQYIKHSLRDEIFSLLSDESLIDFRIKDKKGKGIFSKERDSDQRKFIFFQWVENYIFNSDGVIFYSGGVGVKRMSDDVARFFSLNPQYLPVEYSAISKRSDSSKIRESYNRVLTVDGSRKPLFYILIKKLIDLIDQKNRDLLLFIIESLRKKYNSISSKQTYQETSESQKPSFSDGEGPGLAGYSGSSLSEDERDAILDWRISNKEAETGLLDEEILDKIRQELMEDTDTQRIVENLPNFYGGLLAAKSELSAIKSQLIDGVRKKIEAGSTGSGKKVDPVMYIAVIEAMIDRYDSSLDGIAKRIKKSVDEGADPLDIGLKIDMLSNNLVSFEYDGSEVSLDPLNENGSFDFKSSIPFTQTLEQFRVSSSSVGDELSLTDRIESGDLGAISELVKLLINDYRFTRGFVSGIKKADDNYREDRPQYGVSSDVYLLEVALRETFYDYRVDDLGSKIQRRGGAHPRYAANVNKKKFEETKDDRKRILDEFLMSRSGDEIKSIETLQSAARAYSIGDKRQKNSNKEKFLRSGTRNLVLDSLEDLSEKFSDNKLVKSILASVLNGLRADAIMCDLIGTSGVKGKKGSISDVAESFDDYLTSASDEQKRIAELYVNLFDLRVDSNVDIKDLKVHCLKNKYSFLSPEMRFALVSHAIETGTLDESLVESTSLGRVRAKSLIMHAIDAKLSSRTELYTKKLGMVRGRISSLETV